MWIAIASAGRPHGIKGGASLKFYHEEYAFLEQGDSVLLTPASNQSRLSKEGEIFKISQIIYGHKMMIYFEGINSRTEIENILPFKLEFEEEHFPELDDGELFYHQIIGLKVIDEASEIDLGVVKDVYDNGAQKVITVSGATTFDLPWVEAFIKSVDKEKNEVKIVKPQFT